MIPSIGSIVRLSRQSFSPHDIASMVLQPSKDENARAFTVWGRKPQNQSASSHISPMCSYYLITYPGFSVLFIQCYRSGLGTAHEHDAILISVDPHSAELQQNLLLLSSNTSSNSIETRCTTISPWLPLPASNVWHGFSRIFHKRWCKTLGHHSVHSIFTCPLFGGLLMSYHVFCLINEPNRFGMQSLFPVLPKAQLSEGFPKNPVEL